MTCLHNLFCKGGCLRDVFWIIVLVLIIILFCNIRSETDVSPGI